MDLKCYACNRSIIAGFPVFTSDGQRQFVGPDCFDLVRKAGQQGYQPPLGGPRLFKSQQPGSACRS